MVEKTHCLNILHRRDVVLIIHIYPVEPDLGINLSELLELGCNQFVGTAPLSREVYDDGCL